MKTCKSHWELQKWKYIEPKLHSSDETFSQKSLKTWKYSYTYTWKRTKLLKINQNICTILKSSQIHLNFVIKTYKISRKNYKHIH